MVGTISRFVLGASSIHVGAVNAIIRPREGRSDKAEVTSYHPASMKCSPIEPACRADWYPWLKSAADYLAAAMLLVLMTPVLIVAGILIRATSRGPATYRQVRLGRRGRRFTMFKLRSMAVDCESTSGPRWATPDDPRVGRLGKFLRRSHIDELPQLINILRGEMSLIGPRPERPEFVSRLERTIPLYRDRERVLPGLTGLAQVQLPPDTDVSQVHHKLACDLYYIQHQGPWLDLRILMATATLIAGVPARLSCRILGIPSGAVVEDAYARLASSAKGRGSRAGDPEPSEVSSGWSLAGEAEPALAWGD